MREGYEIENINVSNGKLLIYYKNKRTPDVVGIEELEPVLKRIKQDLRLKKLKRINNE